MEHMIKISHGEEYHTQLQIEVDLLFEYICLSKIEYQSWAEKVIMGIERSSEDASGKILEYSKALGYLYSLFYKKYDWADKVNLPILEVMNSIVREKTRKDAIDKFQRAIHELYLQVMLFHPNDVSNTVKESIKFILDHPYEKISLRDVAENCSVDESYLSHLFRREMKITVVDFITRYKISMIKVLLESTTESIGDITDRLGYTDSKYAERVFHRIEGKSMTEYRKDFEKVVV